MGGTLYSVLRQGVGGYLWHRCILLQKSTHVYIITTFNRILQDNAHQWRSEVGHTGARVLVSRGGAWSVQVCLRIIGVLLIVNRVLNGLEIDWCRNPQNYRALLAPSASGDWRSSSIFQSPDIILVPISHQFLCNYRLTLHRCCIWQLSAWGQIAIMGGGQIFDTGPFFVRLRYSVCTRDLFLLFPIYCQVHPPF